MRGENAHTRMERIQHNTHISPKTPLHCRETFQLVWSNKCENCAYQFLSKGYAIYCAPCFLPILSRPFTCISYPFSFTKAFLIQVILRLSIPVDLDRPIPHEGTWKSASLIGYLSPIHPPVLATSPIDRCTKFRRFANLLRCSSRQPHLSPPLSLILLQTFCIPNSNRVHLNSSTIFDRSWWHISNNLNQLTNSTCLVSHFFTLLGNCPAQSQRRTFHDFHRTAEVGNIKTKLSIRHPRPPSLHPLSYCVIRNRILLGTITRYNWYI